MKRLTGILLGLCLLGMSTPAIADDDFIGFYKGVFVPAGSLDSLSIIPKPAGGYRIILHATRFRRCEGEDRSAVATADGVVRNGVMQRSNGQAVCNANGETANWGDGEMFLSQDDELLTWRTPSGRESFYHRVSD